MLSGSMLPLQIARCRDFFLLVFGLIFQHVEVLFRLESSFQEENNRPVCAVAMAFIVLQKCSLVCLFALLTTLLLQV